ncbi:hypothetical protein niasHS_006017 [Heterodera schachtii]|uniref:C2H2-type domain-containing protein n=1 Tax=Heterodera schachtii TaxID=97005 RepID=A0ABD2JVT4_HETSC
MFSQPAKIRWVCRQCQKSLCSKRSYDEHMNIHENNRPFRCEHCVYAAASQMTLTRHRQRRHTPREQWHYQCPYCAEPYMEPASYSQHVMGRHFGNSATFGCPYGDCPFTCKSSKAFRDHLLKHQAVILSRANGARVQEMFNLNNLVLYMVDDDYGIGNVLKMPSKFPIRYDRSKLAGFAKGDVCLQQIQPVQQQQHHRNAVVLTMTDRNEFYKNRRQKETILRINVDELLDNNETESLANVQQLTMDQQNIMNSDVNDYQTLRVEPVEGQECSFGHVQQDWIIETEVVIDESVDQQMPDGQTDDFGLD